MSSYDVAVIGGGIVGLATARELLGRHAGLKLVVLEKEDGLARHQSGHNSGVIHSGVYYAPGSLKAKLCVEGSRALYRYCEARGLPAERTGKLIVATDETELPRLQALYERGGANGVEGLELIDGEAIKEIEPHCAGIRALWVPVTGIADYRRIVEAYAEDVRAGRGEIRCGHQVASISERDAEVLLTTAGGDSVSARQVVACAGLQSDRVARLSGGAPEPAVVPFRGDYWLLRRPELVRGLIYPVPDPAFPFLGVHFTKRVDGSVWLGPNAVLAFAREGYGRFTVRPRELGAALAHRGFRRLARRYWRTGWGEMVRDFSRRALLKQLRRYLPELTPDDVQPGPSGVRAQALAADGSLVDDFVFDAQGMRILHVRNAPSPAATSSLAIAAVVADRADELANR